MYYKNTLHLLATVNNFLHSNPARLFGRQIDHLIPSSCTNQHYVGSDEC